MKTSFRGLIALCVLPGAALPGEETLPEGFEVSRIEIHPKAVSLRSLYDHRQVLVTGVVEDGSRVDVTRLVSAQGARGIAVVSERGRIDPLADGDAEVTFSLGKHKASLPVSVRGQSAAYDVSFKQDVMPALSKLGCNAGTCHGSAKGKNGFKLSLRGYDPLFDHRALTDDLGGRRFNRAAPDRSLFLLKLSGGVPHVGGVLTGLGEKYYDLLRGWVAQGVEFDAEAPRVTAVEVYPPSPTIPLPGMKQQIAVVATFANGEKRDVTSEAFYESSDTEVASVDDKGLVEALRRGEAAVLVRYEGNYAAAPLLIMGDRSGFEWKEVPEYNYIDTLVYKKLRKIKTLPSEVASDAAFLRRLYIDLTGIPPTPKVVRTFLADVRDSRLKREEAVDRLIGSPEFVDHWTNKWSDLLQVNRKFLGDEGAEGLRNWVRGKVASNVPYDGFVYEILTASGSTLKNPPSAYFKILRQADELMENTTQLFLGVRFNCNKCHDHPFERWTQNNYWELASFFARVGRKDAPGSPTMPQLSAAQQERFAYEEIIFDKEDGEVEAPSGRTALASFPYKHAGEVPSGVGRRETLARWLTSQENPYFAKSFVNRLWSYFLGLGLIDPIDDIRAGNPPTNPELLDRLTEEFVATGFDVRHMMRRILTSRVYQHSLVTNEWNEDDTLNFSHAIARRLPAEVLYDALHMATGSRTRLPGLLPGRRAAELLDSNVKLADGFLDLFGKPPRESSCECERTTGMSLGQSLSLINGPTVADAIRDPENLIAQLVEVEARDEKVVEEIFLSFLCRPPTTEEAELLGASIDARKRANLAALTEREKGEILRSFEAWEAEVNVPHWEVLKADFVKSAAGVEFQRLEDGSILATAGEAPDKDTYTVLGETSLAGLTGLRLEVLPDESLPKKGPGRKEDGAFVLSEISVAAVPLNATHPATAVGLQNASSTYSRRGDPGEAVDGKNDDNRGWGYRGEDAGQSARVVFEFKEGEPSADDEKKARAEEETDPEEDTAGKDAEGGARTLLTVTLDQQRGEQQTLGRFRLWVTATPRPVRAVTAPDDIAAILYTAAEKRTAEQVDALFEYFMKQKPELANVVRRNAAQDIAWALANSPAFLFNR